MTVSYQKSRDHLLRLSFADSMAKHCLLIIWTKNCCPQTDHGLSTTYFLCIKSKVYQNPYIIGKFSARAITTCFYILKKSHPWLAYTITLYISLSSDINRRLLSQWTFDFECWFYFQVSQKQFCYTGSYDSLLTSVLYLNHTATWLCHLWLSLC